MWALFLVFLAASGAAAASGSFFKPGDWYLSLVRPRWTPPGWVFPVVWTTLYIAIAYAAARVAVLPGAGFALALWALQIALNTLWTPVFFGARKKGAGFAIIVLLWLVVAAMVWQFWALDWLAGLLMLPYLAWLSVASTLNFRVWRDNPEPA
ncbi:MAG: sensory protein TspO [Alphaproteobacteria bacterium HGW-Alphaproteobacteria-4]|jgi:tryptophan-rich sensory protein|nr:MAG: sensory protein TspO [Alphaproteobacteria bacterium HGW-Alphaproteobacteria-4]